MSLHYLETKYHYADGGKVNVLANALQAVKTAMAHLDRGDRASAVAALRASPEAMQHPQIQHTLQIMQPIAPRPSAQEVLRRTASQTNPTSGVDPYNTADALAQRLAHEKVLESVMATQSHDPMLMQPGFLTRRQAFASGGSVKPPTDIVAHLAKVMQDHPETQPVLQAHAIALLRANLAAAQAIHGAIGDPSGYGHYAQAASTLAGALGSGASGQSDAATQQMMANVLESSGSLPQAIGPAALQAARQAVPTQKPAIPDQVPVAIPSQNPGPAPAQ